MGENVKRGGAKSIGAVVFMLVTQLASGAEVASFQSVNHPDRYIRHASFVAELTQISSELDQQDATFIVHPALSGTPGALSFEATNPELRGFYLRHQDFRLTLQKNDGSATFAKDASFFPRPGLATPASVSYESVNFARHFIRHSDFHMQLNRDDGGPHFMHDASFRQQLAPTANAPSSCRWDLSGRWRIQQANGFEVYLTLQQSASSLSGHAIACSNCSEVNPDPLYSPNGASPVSGSIDSNTFRITIKWDESKRGASYGGTVNPRGAMYGSTFSLEAPEIVDAFTSTQGEAACHIGQQPKAAGPRVPGGANLPAMSAVQPGPAKPQTPAQPPATPANKDDVVVGADPRIGSILSSSTCQPGFVPRQAGPNDRVCVTPAEHALAVDENTDASTHVDPNGAYGPNTCLAGYVWRNAFSGDGVCVTPAARDRVASENRLGPSRSEER